MQNSRTADFHVVVMETVARIGMSRTRVADEIIGVLFPCTIKSARDEGAERMFRRGVISAVGSVIRGMASLDDDQRSFSELCNEFPIIRDLKSKSYFVEGLGEHVPIEKLVAFPDLLDDARRYMRRKGNECLEEAKRLDVLHEAVTVGTPSITMEPA